MRESRSHATLLAAVTDCPELQRYLPQFVLTKDSVLTNADKDKLRHMVPPKQWFPGTDGWVTTDNLKPLFTALRRSVRERAPGADIVLIMDSASQHTNRSVLMHANSLGLHVILVPSGLTWLLQPLDSHVFAHLKRVLADEQGRRRGGALTGVLPRGVWVEIVEHAIKQVPVDGVWAQTFAANGLASTQLQLRERIGSSLGCNLPLPLRPPTDLEMDIVVGRHRVGLQEIVLRHSVRTLREADGVVRGPPLVLGRMLRLDARPPAACAAVRRLPPADGLAAAAGAVVAEPEDDIAGEARVTRSGRMY